MRYEIHCIIFYIIFVLVLFDFVLIYLKLIFYMNAEKKACIFLFVRVKSGISL